MKDIAFKNLYLNRFLGDFLPIMLLVGLLLRERSFSLSIISFFFLYFSVTVLVFEMPGGVLADKVGSRLTLMLSRAAKLLAFITLLFAYSQAFLLLAAFLWGVASALDSGAIQSHTYKLTRARKGEKSFQSVYGKTFTSSLMGLLAAGVVVIQINILGFVASVFCLFFRGIMITPILFIKK